MLPVLLTDSDVSIRALQHLVHALGPKGGPQRPGYCLGCQDVGLDCLCSAQPRLAALILQYHTERLLGWGPPAVLHGQQRRRLLLGAQIASLDHFGGVN